MEDTVACITLWKLERLQSVNLKDHPGIINYLLFSPGKRVVSSTSGNGCMNHGALWLWVEGGGP